MALKEIRYKKPARKLNIRRRYCAINSREKIASNKLRKYALLYLLRSKYLLNIDDSKKFSLHLISKYLMFMYYKIVLCFEGKIERPIQLSRDINSFSESDCWNFFEMRKIDMYRVLIILRLNDCCKFPDKSTMSGEEVFLRGMYELVNGESQHSIAAHVFGHEQSRQSRAFSYFINHIYFKFTYLVFNNLNWWYSSGFMKKSLDAIEMKCANLGLNFDTNTFRVAAFIDCKCSDMCRVAGGPNGEGPNADRWDSEIQQAFYNGWKSIHGLKHQTMDLAYGITADLYGPTSLRRNDLRLLGLSELNERLEQISLGEIVNMCAYGDSIYPYLSNIMSSWRYLNNSERQKLENSVMKKVRITIEWNYGVTSNIFSYLKNFDKLRLFKSNVVAKVFTVCTILKNMHVCLYGCISSQYFNLEIPHDMLERYVSQLL